MFRFLRFLLRTGLPLAALGLHLVIVLCFARRWDRATAITVLPFWAWGFVGLALAGLSFLIFRSRLALVVTLLWLVTIIIGADETRPLLRFTAEPPRPGPPADFSGKKALRVVSLNCKRFNPVSVEETLAWEPDIILLQEAPFPGRLLEIAKKLYPTGRPQDHVVGGYDCAVLARGKVVPLSDRSAANIRPDLVHVLPCAVQFEDRMVHVVCVHLQGAVTNMSLYKKSTWELHYRNRQSRRSEMILARVWLHALNLNSTAPIIIGGDFNAPAGDAVFRELEPDFTDAFRATGSGWANTFPNATPLVRIDYIFANQHLTPIRSSTVQTANSDHRMVVADFVEAK